VEATTHPSEWKFLTNFGLTLICIAADPGVRMRDIAERVGITERAAHRIVAGLVNAGYIAKERTGRRNSYEIRADLPLQHPLERDLQLGNLLDAVQGTRDQQTPERN
jgi:predicted transcriptional regulator